MKKSIIPLVFCTITHYPDLYLNRHSNIVDFIGNAKGIYILRKPLTKCDIKDACAQEAGLGLFEGSHSMMAILFFFNLYCLDSMNLS